jgi:hypothetical protein
VEPGPLAEDVRCPPTSSWWALETPLTLARCGSGRRPSGGRCGGGGAIGGEIAPPPPTQVFLNTARPDGHITSKQSKRGGGSDCRRSSMERCPPDSGSVATDRAPCSGVLICGRIGATAPTRSDGEISDRGQHMSRRGARECCLSRERLAPCGRGEAATSITTSEPSRTEGGLGTGTVSVRRPATPPDRRSRLSAPSPDPGYRIREVETRRGEAEGDGAAEDRCKGTEQAWRITARSYRVDLRRRGTSGASARSEKGVFT